MSQENAEVARWLCGPASESVPGSGTLRPRQTLPFPVPLDQGWRKTARGFSQA